MKDPPRINRMCYRTQLTCVARCFINARVTFTIAQLFYSEYFAQKREVDKMRESQRRMRGERDVRQIYISLFVVGFFPLLSENNECSLAEFYTFLIVVETLL